jgi:galactokinase
MNEELVRAVKEVNEARQEYTKRVQAMEDAYIKLSQSIIHLDTMIDVMLEGEQKNR